MPKYIVSSDTPITAQEVGGGGGGEPTHPWVPPGDWSWPERPAHPIYPTLPPKEDWPPLPPGLGEGGIADWIKEKLPPHVALPIPPTPEHPMVPIPDDPEIDPPGIWPPVRPEFPDLGGKTLALALIFVSRHVAKLHWIVIDHEEAKEKLEAIKNKLPHPEHPIAPGGIPQPKR